MFTARPLLLGLWGVRMVGDLVFGATRGEVARGAASFPTRPISLQARLTLRHCAWALDLPAPGVRNIGRSTIGEMGRATSGQVQL